VSFRNSPFHPDNKTLVNMSKPHPRSNQPRRNTKSKRVQLRDPNNLVRLGSVQRPPGLATGTQSSRIPMSMSRKYKRLFKYRIILNTTGTQSFFLTSVFIYQPFTANSVISGTNTISTSYSATATNLFAAFQYYKVNSIYIAYCSYQSTATPLPPVYCALQPGSSPFVIGTTANTGIINSVQNSIQIDPHFSTSFTYVIPQPSDISLVAGNELERGWIPTAYGATTPLTTTSGVITFATGDSAIPAPLSTIFGVVDVEYDIDFKLPE
jgi:hypothetical protein